MSDEMQGWMNANAYGKELITRRLLAALCLCLPILEVNAEMSHFLQGFARMETKEDRILKRIKDAISKADIPAEREG